MTRESMKNISRIFSSCLCCASLFAFDAFGVVATNSGSNLTSYNPSNAYNNQWSTLTNARYNDPVSAKADFGNCNAVILRCAQPKCGNGGCDDKDIATAIVKGCVKSNATCKKHGDDLIASIAAQLMVSSKTKINTNNAEQIAAAQAAAEQAQAASEQAIAAQQQQMAEMQNNMQQQMLELQQRMADQNAESARQIADALERNQQQQQAAISEMKSAAQTAANRQMSGEQNANIPTVTEQGMDAVERGVDINIVKRVEIGPEIMSEIEGAKAALREAYAAMDAAFVYAGCDSRGDDCGVPKRIKKWRELASGFIEPYDKVADQILIALQTAQLVGVDVSEIYMMLNDSCNTWGEYLCPYKGENDETAVIRYNPRYSKSGEKQTDEQKMNKGEPRVCRRIQVYNETTKKSESAWEQWEQCEQCTLLRLLADKQKVYEGWVNTTNETSENQRVIACASGALDKSPLFSHKLKTQSGAGIIDIDKLAQWINQRESSTATPDTAFGLCSVENWDKHN